MTDNPNIIICLACEHTKLHHHKGGCTPVFRGTKVREEGDIGYEIGLGPDIICVSEVGTCDCKGFK